MSQVFNVVEAINEEATRFHETSGFTPTVLSVSRALYRRLVELRCQNQRIGNLVIGCAPLASFLTPVGDLAVVIDEMLVDDALEVS
jgi:hypothetical protein